MHVYILLEHAATHGGGSLSAVKFVMGLSPLIHKALENAFLSVSTTRVVYFLHQRAHVLQGKFPFNERSVCEVHKLYSVVWPHPPQSKMGQSKWVRD